MRARPTMTGMMARRISEFDDVNAAADRSEGSARSLAASSESQPAPTDGSCDTVARAPRGRTIVSSEISSRGVGAERVALEDRVRRPDHNSLRSALSAPSSTVPVNGGEADRCASTSDPAVPAQDVTAASTRPAVRSTARFWDAVTTRTAMRRGPKRGVGWHLAPDMETPTGVQGSPKLTAGGRRPSFSRRLSSRGQTSTNPRTPRCPGATPNIRAPRRRTEVVAAGGSSPP